MQKISTKGKKFEALQKQLKKDNAKFKKLTRAQQRVAIAEDVIAQIGTKKFLAKSTYFKWGKRYEITNELSLSLDKAIDKELDASACISQVQCSVCGIGSLLLSGIRKNDQVSIDTFYTWDRQGDIREAAVDYLDKWFDDDQLELIEHYYERYNGCIYASPIYAELDNNKRLTMIMQNIISNKGRFNPQRGAHKVVISE